MVKIHLCPQEPSTLMRNTQVLSSGSPHSKLGEPRPRTGGSPSLTEEGSSPQRALLIRRCWSHLTGEGALLPAWCLPGSYCSLRLPSLTRIFGFVAKSQTESQENVCHLFAEYDVVQPASQVISLVGALLQDTERM